MFTYIKVSNYKSFTDVKADFTNKKKQPKKLILIYGENGSGKSNLASAFYTLAEMLRTMNFRELISKFQQQKHSEENSQQFMEMIKDRFRDMETIIKKSKTINSKGNMVLEYGINIKGKDGFYHIETDYEKVVNEELYFPINKNKSYYFKFSQESKKINPSIILDNNYMTELNDKIDKFWGKHTFLSILFDEINDKAKGYVKKKVSPYFWEVITFLFSFSCSVKDGISGGRGTLGLSHEILGKLRKGEISIDEESELEKAENFLRELFTSLYSDIKDVYYSKEKVNGNIRYKLFEKKLICNEIKDIDFRLESTGTLQLLNLVPAIYMAVSGSTVIIDEFDSGIHDLMVRNVLMEVNRALKGQLIITTHNTLLMEKSIPIDSIYFIIIDSNGNKDIACVTDYETRTYPGNNVRDLYLKGLYEGIPYFSDFDLEEMIKEFNQ